MIEKIRLQNFKGIRDVEVGLERLTVFVGPNASGKTSILQGVELVSNSSFIKTRFQTSRLLSSGDFRYKGADDQDVTLTCSTGVGTLRLVIKPTTIPRGDWECELSASKFHEIDELWIPINDLAEVQASLTAGELYRFDAIRMAEATSEVGLYMASNGSGLASMLALIALNQPERFSFIQKELAALIPSMSRVRFERKTLALRQVRSEDGGARKRSDASSGIADSIIFDLKSGLTIPATAASEGTVLLLGLLTVLAKSQRRLLLLLDDLDRGLHPLVQHDIILLLRRLLEQHPDLQIIATTHSPYLVDKLRPEEVRLTALREDGTVACARLEDHPDYQKWKDEFFPGELWSMFGEKWVADQAARVTR